MMLLREIEKSKEVTGAQQKHEMEMETMKLKHKKEVEKLRIESDRESERHILKIKQMKLQMDENDKKLQLEKDKYELSLKHETERMNKQNDNQMKLDEIKINKRSEVIQSTINALQKRISNKEEALALKRKGCEQARQDARDAGWFSGDKYKKHAEDMCRDDIYRVELNELTDELSSLTQGKQKLINDGSD